MYLELIGIRQQAAPIGLLTSDWILKELHRLSVLTAMAAQFPPFDAMNQLWQRRLVMDGYTIVVLHQALSRSIEEMEQTIALYGRMKSGVHLTPKQKTPLVYCSVRDPTLASLARDFHHTSTVKVIAPILLELR